MPLKLYKRKTRGGISIWHYRGTVDGCRLRGTTGTADRKAAAKFAAQVETKQYEGGLFASKTTLTFPQAVTLYLKAGKGGTKRETLYIGRLEDYWKNTRVKNMNPGAIRQSAIDIHPNHTGATRNRQVITMTGAIINHCAELELCAPIRLKRFDHEKKIKKPVTVEWLESFCIHARPINVALAVFMFATGCRISEAKRLDWPDINFQERTLHIVKTKAKKQRMPHMPNRLLVALANLPRGQRPFGSVPESRLRREWDEDIAKTAAAVPGFVRLTFHSCRHGIATKLLRDKVDVKTISELIGMSPQVLLSTYAHAMNDTNLIDRVFDTPATREEGDTKQKQEVSGK